MEIDEGLTTKLWFEKRNHVKIDEPHLSYYKIVKHHFNKKKASELHSFLQNNGLTWQELLHLAWGILLNRLSSSNVILYGSATFISASHEHFKIKTNPLIVKSTINNALTLKNYLTELQSELSKRPKKKIIDEVRYLLLFKNPAHSSKKIITLSYQRFPLILICPLTGEDEFEIHYHSALFLEKNIESFFVHLQLLIDDIIDEKKEGLLQKISLLNLLTVEEEQSIFHDWNKPTYEFSIPTLSKLSHELLAEQAKKNPKKMAILHTDQVLTYELLNEQITVVAQQLLINGLQPGDRIAVLMERTPALLIVMYAIFTTGGVYVPINTKYPDERIDFVLTNAEVKLIVVDDRQKISASFQDKVLVFTELVVANFIANLALPTVTLDDIAYIIYTSGTTGLPKGVMIRHRSLVNLIAWYQALFKINSEDRASQFASMAFDTFLCETVPFLASGASVHMVDDSTKLTPSLFFTWLVEQKITLCDLPTSYAQMLFAMTWPSHTSLKLIKIGGEALNSYPDQILPFDIWNTYGPTETTVETTYIKLYEAHQAPHKKNKYRTIPPIGKPLCNSEIYVVDDNLQPVPIGIAGELLIGGEGVSPGYFNQPELTADKFIAFALAPNSGKFYRTGDLVRWLSDGNLEFIGRRDHQVKIRGYRIELGDIENAISQHPDVSEVAVMIREDLRGEKSLVAYIVPNLDKNRYVYQEKCLIYVNDQFIEAITEDISKNGLAISGIDETLNEGQPLQLHLKLPGFPEIKIMHGHLIWQKDNRCGIAFDFKNDDAKIISNSINYYLSNHNVMELILSTAAKRSLANALSKKIPDYMVPKNFINLLQFPLTFSGKIDLKALPPLHHFADTKARPFTAAKTTTEKKLTSIWKKVLLKKQISMTDNFFDLGGSSLTMAELSVEILLRFNISIPAKILFDLAYIPILAEYIDTQGKSYAKKTLVQAEIDHDSNLAANMILTKKLSPHLHQPKNILLTGANGFVGLFLLRQLLQQTNATIYCLVRKKNLMTAKERLYSALKQFNLHQEIDIKNSRIVIITSDISFDHFGLALEQYNDLATKIDLIFHCGAEVNTMASYNKLRKSNVQGTLEIIKFATKVIDKPIHYISTLTAATEKNSDGYFTETFPSISYHDLSGGYGLSKWVAERLLTVIKERGLPVTIYRCGYIAGESHTGIANLNDGLLMLIKGCIQLGAAPNIDEKVTIVPVDFMSQLTCKISLQAADKSNVYHIDHPTGILWMDLVSWINDYGYQIKLLSLKAWQQLLLNISQDNALFPLLPYYLSLDGNHYSTEADISKTTQFIQQHHLKFPDISSELLTLYFDFLCQSNFLSYPSNIPQKIPFDE